MSARYCANRFEEGLGHKAISYRVGAAPSTVRETRRRAEAAGLVWPLGDEITGAVLEAALYKANGTKTGHRRSVEPDWAHVHRELKRKHVTLQILWDEYIERHPDGYRYSRFCDLYRGWAANLPVTMRQNHAAGDKLFVDYAGDTVTVIVDRPQARRDRRICSWRCWAPRACPMPRRAGAKRWRTGSAAMSMPWRRSVALRRCDLRP